MDLSSIWVIPQQTPTVWLCHPLSSGLCLYGVSKLGAWNLGQWGLASWNDNAMLSYCQGWYRFGHLMPFGLGAGEPCNTAGTQPWWWTTTWWNAWMKNVSDFMPHQSAYIFSMHGVVLSRYAVRCPPPVLCWEMGFGIGLRDLHDIQKSIESMLFTCILALLHTKLPMSVCSLCLPSHIQFG